MNLIETGARVVSPTIGKCHLMKWKEYHKCNYSMGEKRIINKLYAKEAGIEKLVRMQWMDQRRLWIVHGVVVVLKFIVYTHEVFSVFSVSQSRYHVVTHNKHKIGRDNCATEKEKQINGETELWHNVFNRSCIRFGRFLYFFGVGKRTTAATTCIISM